MICDAFEVVAVPFPFADRPDTKLRPGLVLSRQEFNGFGYTILAMITSARRAPRPGDVPIQAGLREAGLSKPSMIRLKLFTLDNELIVRRLGALSPDDRNAVLRELRRFVV